MRKVMKNTILTLLILTLSVSVAWLIYLHFFAEQEESLAGEWTTHLDVAEQAAVTALSWLQDIEAVSISLEDMESYMQELTIDVCSNLEQTGQSGGTFRCNVLPESYDACNQAAYEAFAMAFRELLAERLRMAGYTGGTDREAIEVLVTETFGMSTVAYLMTCGPALLPSLEELQAQYNGSGTYETAEGILTRQYEAGQPVSVKAEYYIRKDTNLILYEEIASAPSGSLAEQYPIMYTLESPQ